MVSWWWLPVAFFAGVACLAVFSALVVGGEADDRDEAMWRGGAPNDR